MEGRLWPDRLTVGDRVRFDAGAYTITKLYGRQLTLVETNGQTRTADALTVLRDPDFAVLEREPTHISARKPPTEGSDRDVTAVARWWEPHIVEVLSGVPPGASAGTVPRPEFDPLRHSLAERERAKAEELARLGVSGASARTVRRKRQRYQAQGVVGLADGRAGRREAPGARLDPRVVATVRDIVLSHTGSQRPSSERVLSEALRRLADPVFRGEISVPSRSAVHRLCTELADDAHTYRPRGELSSTVGERVHLDVVTLPLHPGGEQGRVQVMFAMDEATRLVVAAVAHCDRRRFSLAPAVLARMCVPQDERAEWAGLRPAARSPRAEAQSAAPSVEPSPLVRPQMLVFDDAVRQGLGALRNACGRLGIHTQHARRSPGQRSVVERSMAQAASLFTDYLLSSAGRDAHAAGWSQEMVQKLLDTWVMRVWPYAEVSLSPRKRDAAPTPAARYADLTSQAGWMSTPLPPGDFVHLLTEDVRVMGPGGLRLLGRAYNAPALDLLHRHRRGAADAGHNAQFEVRRDPYDLGHVWVRGQDGRWLKVPAVPQKPEVPQDAVVHASCEQTAAYITTSSASSESVLAPEASQVTEAAAPARPALLNVPHTPPLFPLSAEDHVTALHESQRLAYHAQLAIHSSGVEAAVRRIEEVLLLNQASRGNRYGVLVHGPSGTGKSTVLTEAALHFDQGISRPATTGGPPAIRVQLPPATSPRLLLAELARSFGIALRGSPTTVDLTAVVAHALEESRTSLVLIDEAHHLRSPGWSQAAVTDVLDYLCDRVPATFVYAGLTSEDSLVSSLAHAPHRRLLPVPLSDVPETDSWTDLLHRVEQNLRLRAHRPGTLTALSHTLHRRTGGNIGRLAFLVRAAAVRAIQDGTEQLTSTLLAELPLPGPALSQDSPAEPV
ncbi:AAA family ATPase [Streptomyces adonidis]|uniref:AAA family ATPase n=1 Tax=Streptomyces adonidis TaxID=3231367 RepID=UPI0034DB2BE1